MKKVLSALIVAVMLIGMLPAITIPAFAEVTTGTTGDCTWTLNGTELTIRGDGAMADYDWTRSYYAPWGTDITKVTIESGVTYIGECAFYRCKLSSVSIPDGVTSIGYAAFEYCSGLTSVTIPDSVVSIGNAAFEYCTGLTLVTIPDSVTSIGAYAFYYCTGLTSVIIGNGVTTIGVSAFYGCSGLAAVHITDLAKWCAIEYMTDTMNAKTPLYYAQKLYLNGELITNLVIPNGITSIGDSAFEYCTGLTSVTIPDSVTSIGKGAFSGCTGLTSITIPDSVTSIGNYSFCDCYNLKEVECQAAVSSIPASTFSGCDNLKRIYLPAELSLVYSSNFPNPSLQRVFFGGTQAQREAMTIQHSNNGLLNAKWSYNETGLPDHSYTNGCDADCNECGMTRNVAGHKFGSYVYNNDATSQKDGTKTRICSVCKKTETVTATGTKLQNPFNDVKANEYYTEPVLWAVSKKITNGMSETSFAPNNECTRGQIVTFLWRAAGSPEPTRTKNPFTDVSSNAYYYKAVLWAVEKGITTGTSANTFSPDAGCTRGQVVTFLHRAKGKPAASGKNAFADVKSGAYYYDAVRWAVANNVTNGMSANSFAPDATCTRGQIVTFLFRAYN